MRAAPLPFGPFKAAHSYGPADDLLFHGRDAEGAALAHFVAARPFSIVTAPSGMGKTSLLHARVLPLLERDRWLTVYARPRDDVLASLRDALAEHLLPDLRDEARAVEDLVRRKPEWRGLALHAALERYAALPIETRVEFRHCVPAGGEELAPLPMFSRVLRGTLALADWIEHLEALVIDGSPMGISPHTPLEEVPQRLRCDAARALWARWRERLGCDCDTRGALERLQSEWAPLRPGLGGVLLVLDQFEEVFTRASGDVASALFTEFSGWLDAGAAVSRRLHLVLSMRKEFYADVVPYLARFGSAERLTHFLGLLPAPQALAALRTPAALFGVTFDEPGGCLPRVLSLTLDDGEIFDRHEFDPPLGTCPPGRYSPTLISLIGAHLWARLEAQPAAAAMPLTWEAFKRLVPDLDDVFRSFLDNTLSHLDGAGSEPNAERRFDALELLERLVTSTGYRNIVAEEELLRQIPLERQAAKALLDTMDRDLKLVRRESRGRARFVEITHERLIPPVRCMLVELRRKPGTRGALAQAHDMIQVLQEEPDPVRDLLMPQYRDALVAHLPRLELDAVSLHTLLRSLLNSAPDQEGPALQAWRQAVRRIAALLAQGDATAGPARRPLLRGGALDAQLEAWHSQGGTPDAEALRALLRASLSQRDARAGERIRRAFRLLTSKEQPA